MRIWFNRGFSLAPIAKAMMAADPSLQVIVSTGEGLPIYEGPTETWVEPKLKGEEYLNWVRTQIIEHSIDVFVPTTHRELIAGTNLPCKVHLPADIGTLVILDDKYLFAEAVKDEAFYLPTFSVKTATELSSIIAQFRAENDNLDPCVKPRSGVNGHGFWTLTQGNALTHLLTPEDRRMQQDVYLATLQLAEEVQAIDPLVVMPYLPGPEVSFDILAQDGLILKYVARTKLKGRQRLQSTHPSEEAAQRLVARFNLSGVINLQFRRAADDSWRILEINARPAGGSVYSEQFGSSLLADWGGILSGRITPETINKPVIDLEIEKQTSLHPFTPELAA